MNEPVTVVLRSGELLTIRLLDQTVEIANGERWAQRLTRAEAWQLAEALDTVATAADAD